jgi:hypothetical protein
MTIGRFRSQAERIKAATYMAQVMLKLLCTGESSAQVIAAGCAVGNLSSMKGEPNNGYYCRACDLPWKDAWMA